MDPSVDPFTADTVANAGYLYTTDQRLPQQPAGQPSPHRRQPGGNCAGRRVDIGCGDGAHTSDLFEATGATSVSGLDPTENAVRVAQEKVRVGPSPSWSAVRSNCLTAAAASISRTYAECSTT